MAGPHQTVTGSPRAPLGWVTVGLAAEVVAAVLPVMVAKKLSHAAIVALGYVYVDCVVPEPT